MKIRLNVKSLVLTLFVGLVIIPNIGVQATPPDKYVFSYDDTHAAPRFTQYCGFPVVVEEKGLLTDIIHYDNAGNFISESLTFQHAESVITNSTSGKSLVTPVAGLVKYGLQTASSSGLVAQYHTPGGGLIMLDAGRFVVDLATGERTFEVGHHDYIDGDWQALCNALAKP